MKEFKGVGQHIKISIIKIFQFTDNYYKYYLSKLIDYKNYLGMVYVWRVCHKSVLTSLAEMSSVCYCDPTDSVRISLERLFLAHCLKMQVGITYINTKY